MTRQRFRGALSVAATVCTSLGLLLTTFFVIAQADQHVSSATAIEAFNAALDRDPDRSLWSSVRKRHFEESLVADLGVPTGILDIPTIELEVPIFKGADELVLNRGIGWIESTAHPGDLGNVGLAGHRDGFFRGLKDVAIGDAIVVTTLNGAHEYRVSELLIVEPEDVYVLDPTETAMITLVTCYPFYFIGHAPQRFIVRGVAVESSQP
jgi:sortase A